MSKSCNSIVEIVERAEPISDAEFEEMAVATVRMLRQADAEERAEIEQMILLQEQIQRELMAA